MRYIPTREEEVMEDLIHSNRELLKSDPSQKKLYRNRIKTAKKIIMLLRRLK